MIVESPLEDETVRDFRVGYCHMLAQDLKDQYRWEIWGIKTKQRENYWHFLNETCDQYFIDAKGIFRDPEKLKSSWSSDKKFVLDKPDPQEYQFDEPLFDDIRGYSKEVAKKLFNWYQTLKIQNEQYLVKDL